MAIPYGLSKWAVMIKGGLMSQLSDRRWNAASWATRHGALRSLIRGEEGGPLVEIALTVPVLLAVLTGICSFGIAFSNQLTLTQAVGASGQYLSQLRTSTTDPCASAYSALTSAAPNLSPSKITMTVTLNGTSYQANTCSGKQTQMVQGSPVSVNATDPCSLAVYGVNFAGNCLLAARVTEYAY